MLVPEDTDTAEPVRSDVDARRLADDPACLESFYREHVRLIERFVARRTSDPNRVADLTADIFVQAIESASRYRPSMGSATAWLFGIAHHVVSADRRRVFRERRAVARIAGRRLLEGDDVARIEERIDAEAAGRVLSARFAQLSEPDRGLLELTAVDGLSVTEASHALGITPGAARVRLHRARRRLHLDSAIDDPASPAQGEAT